MLLCNLMRTDFYIGDDVPSPQSYEAEICITRDSPFSVDFDLGSFNHLRVELVGLEEWLKLDSIRIEDKYIHEEDVEVRVKYKNHKFSYERDDVNISIESLTLGALPFALLFDSPERVVSFKQTHYLVYTPNAESSLNSLLYDFNRIEEFFALLLGSYSGIILSIGLADLSSTN